MLERFFGHRAANKPFGMVLSLGGVCQTAYQIEACLGFRVSSVFDWLVTPFESIGKILDDDGVNLGKSVHVINNGGTAVCSYYGVAYHHDFPRDGDSNVHISIDALQNCASKNNAKFQTFKKHILRGERTLFVRLGGHHDSSIADPYAIDPRVTTTLDLNNLCATVSRHFPTLDFEIAFISIAGVTRTDIDEAALDRRIHLHALDDYHGHGWQGSTSRWAEVLGAYNIDVPHDVPKKNQYHGAVVDPELFQG